MAIFFEVEATNVPFGNFFARGADGGVLRNGDGSVQSFGPIEFTAPFIFTIQEDIQDGETIGQVQVSGGSGNQTYAFINGPGVDGRTGPWDISASGLVTKNDTSTLDGNGGTSIDQDIQITDGERVISQTYEFAIAEAGGIEMLTVNSRPATNDPPVTDATEGTVIRFSTTTANGSVLAETAYFLHGAIGVGPFIEGRVVATTAPASPYAQPLGVDHIWDQMDSGTTQVDVRWVADESGNAWIPLTADTGAQSSPPRIFALNVIESLVETTDTTNAVKVGEVVAVGGDTANLVYALTGADAADFEIVVNGNNRDLRLVAGTSLDFETKDTYSATVTVNDPAIAGDPDDSYDFVLNIADFNFAPTGSSPQAMNVQDGDTGGASAGTVAASDPEGETLTYSFSESQSDFSINSSTGEITVKTGVTIDFATTPSYSIVVNVSDGVNTLPIVVDITVDEVSAVAIRWPTSNTILAREAGSLDVSGYNVDDLVIYRTTSASGNILREVQTYQVVDVGGNNQLRWVDGFTEASVAPDLASTSSDTPEGPGHEWRHITNASDFDSTNNTITVYRAAIRESIGSVSAITWYAV